MLLLGCNTGSDITVGGTTYNLVDAIYEKGAHFVMGATEIMYVDTNDLFLYWFMYGLNQGKSIEEAYEFVHDMMDDFYIGVQETQSNGKITTVRTPIDYFPGYLVGDQKQYLN